MTNSSRKRVRQVAQPEKMIVETRRIIFNTAFDFNIGVHSMNSNCPYFLKGKTMLVTGACTAY